MFTCEDEYSVPCLDSYKIIIDDNDCSDIMFSEICSYLSESGLNFAQSKSGKNINVDNSIVITIDQQYSSGDETKVFAPCDNTRGGYSDALALSMRAALLKEQIRTDDIVCGKYGYHEEDGIIHHYSLTDTETKIDKMTDCSFITISLGTQCANPKEVAIAIRNGIARFFHYISNHSDDIDLIYRCNEDDTLENIAEHFNSTTTELKNNNNIKTNHFFNSQAITNPRAKYVTSFNQDCTFTLNMNDIKHM